MACWSTKAAISLKPVKIEEKLLWRAYKNSPTLFRTVYHRRSRTASSSPRLGVRNPQTSIAIISETGWDCFRARSRQIKNHYSTRISAKLLPFSVTNLISTFCTCLTLRNNLCQPWRSLHSPTASGFLL